MGTQRIGERLWPASFRRRILGRLPFFLLVAAIAPTLACKKGATVAGRVINAKTGQPVSGAKVEVRFQRLDANYNWVDGGHADLTSGATGEFSAESLDLRARFVVLAKCDGFYPNYDCRPRRRVEYRVAHMTHHVEVQLCPVMSPQPLPRGQGEVRFYPPMRRMGWNFAAGRTVPEAEADFVGEPDESSQRIAILAARGRGGFFRVEGLSGEWALFNTPVAPNSGYSDRVDLRAVPEGERACYFVRTADGAHYGKIDVGSTLESRDFRGIRFYWVYQPNGSRALEIPLP